MLEGSKEMSKKLIGNLFNSSLYRNEAATALISLFPSMVAGCLTESIPDIYVPNFEKPPKL